MEIRRWLYYVVINCVIVCCIVGKPFSLNTLIEAESQEKEVVHTTISPKLEALEESEPAAERFSLNKSLKPLSRISKKFKETGNTLNLIPLSQKISPFKYRKTFQIKSPLKPKRVKHSLRTRHKRKNQSVKSEVDGNAILNQKYIPLLKNLGMLFDNILGSDSRESFEVTKNKRKRFNFFPQEIEDVTCKCPLQRESDADSKSEEKTITPSETLTSKVSVTTETATQTADNTPAGNIRSFRQNKNLPLLLPRNTLSARRNNHGLGERSSTAYNGSAERYISWDHGDSEHDTERGQSQSGTESDEEHTDSSSRNDASGVPSRGRIRVRGGRNNAEEEDENDAIPEDETEKLLDSERRHVVELNGQDQLETGRYKAKSAKLLSEPILRKRGSIERSSVSEDSIGETAESVQSEEDNEKGELSIAYHSSGNQRFINRDGSLSSEDQKASTRHETVTDQAHELDKSQYRLPKYTKRSKTTMISPAVQTYQESIDRSNTSEDEVNDNAQTEQSGEINVDDAHNSSSDDYRIFDTEDLLSSEDQKTDKRHEAVIIKPPELGKPQYYSTKHLKTSKTKGRLSAVRRQELIDQSSTSEDEMNETPQSVQSEEGNKEPAKNTLHNSSGHQQIFDKDDLLSSKDQNAVTRHELVIIKPPELEKPQYLKNVRTKGILPSVPKQESIDLSSISEDEVSNSAQSAQFEENIESEVNVAHDTSSDNQRIFYTGDLLSSENEKVSKRHETTIITPPELSKPQYYSTKYLKIPKTKEHSPTIQRQKESNYQPGISGDEINNTSQSVQPEEDNKDGEVNAVYNNSGDQQIFDRDDIQPSEDLKASQLRHEDVTHKSYKQNKSQYYSTSYSKKTRNKGLLPETVPRQGLIDQLSIYEGQDSGEPLADVQSNNDNGENKEDQKSNIKLETVTHLTTRPLELNQLQNDSIRNKTTSKTKGPVVVIFDGYSVTRHKNGENKLTEKAIHIQP